MSNFFRDQIRLNTDSPRLTTIDSHTEGEITRLIVDGLEEIPGSTMRDKLGWFKDNCDHLRQLLTREPRGSREILAAAVTQSVSKEAAFGLLYMDARRYPYLCGHATIGAMVTLAKTGFLKLVDGENRVGVDTPSGMMEARVVMDGDNVESVAIRMVPSFVYETGRTIEVKGFGAIPVDIVCTGGFFAMVDAQKIGMSVELKNRDAMIDLGMKIIDAANEQLTISHPERLDVNTIDVTEFYDTDHEKGSAAGHGMVIYGESHMDRSPCGTGTAAKLALLHHYGKLTMNEPYTNYSPLGTFFDARLVEKKMIPPFEGTVAEIKGMAYITGIHHFVIEDHDPFQQGYLI